MYSRLLPQDIKLCYYTQKHFRRNLIMEPLFVAEWKYDKKTIYELIPLFRKILCYLVQLLLLSHFLSYSFFVFLHENGLFDGSGIFLLSVAAFFCTMPYIRTSIKNSNVFQILQKLFLRTG